MLITIRATDEPRFKKLFRRPAAIGANGVGFFRGFLEKGGVVEQKQPLVTMLTVIIRLRASVFDLLVRHRRRAFFAITAKLRF